MSSLPTHSWSRRAQAPTCTYGKARRIAGSRSRLSIPRNGKLKRCGAPSSDSLTNIWDDEQMRRRDAADKDQRKIAIRLLLSGVDIPSVHHDRLPVSPNSQAVSQHVSLRYELRV